MPVNIGLAQLSDHFLLSTVFLYALAMLAYAGDFAFGRAAGQPDRQAGRPGYQAGQDRQSAGVAVAAAVRAG
ncbi:MAG TPA: hypothetical protein VIV12_15660, partial [Streptosporangiaceae bacterium]